jgi:hypothetical protein
MKNYFKPFILIIIIIWIFSFFIFSLFYSIFDKRNITNNIINTNYNPNYPLIILFGATSKNSELLLENELNNKYNIVCVSRRQSKWTKMIENNKKIKNKSFIWIHGDTRLHRDIENVFKEIKLWSKNATIDLVINAALINVNKDLLKVPFQTQRDSDDIVIRITGAYDREYEFFGKQYRKHGMGNENGFITNIIGSLNVVRLSEEFGVKKIVLPKNNFILKDWFDSNVNNIEFIDMIKDKIIIENLLKKLN